MAFCEECGKRAKCKKVCGKLERYLAESGMPDELSHDGPLPRQSDIPDNELDPSADEDYDPADYESGGTMRF